MTENVHIEPTITSVSLASLDLTGSVRSDGESAEHIHRLIEAEWPLAPILVHWPTLRVIDGFHRAAAAYAKGLTHIDARFVDAAEDDIYMMAVKENVTHGLPLSLADRRVAAARILALQPSWSDRAISGVTGLSDKTIASIRRSTANHPQLNHRVGKDGRNRPTSPAAARQHAAELIRQQPEASLRDIAHQIGVSPSTVRDVRLRLSRGESPVRPPRPVRSTDNGTPAVRAKVRDPGTPADIGSILTSLARDPALRMSTTGREMVRWIHSHAINPDDAQRIFASTPPHCTEQLIEIAQRCALNWACIAHALTEIPPDTSTAVS